MKSFLKWTLLLTGLMPVVYSADSLFPFIFPKALYFRFMIFLAVTAFCVLCAMDTKFRDEMIFKIKSLWKHSVFKLMAFMHGGLVLSTIFAYDRYMAMFGNIEREEGFVGLFFFYVFFVLLTMVFEKKDWLRFFAVTLVSAGVLFMVELNQHFSGNMRSGSLTDNPIFLSAYYLFVIVSSFVLWKTGREKNNKLVMVVSTLFVLISILGLIMAETRGVILGMIASFFFILVYLSFRGKNIVVMNNMSLRKLSSRVLAFFVIVFIIFLFTRSNSFWTHVPGLERVSQISLNDGATSARIVNASIALHAVNPTEASITRTLFGWGWDNYVYAWQKFYQPKLYGYDQALFDRAHNRVLDVLLMSGFVGFVLYLLTWFLFFKKSLCKNIGIFESSLFIFWGVSYFLQNLTVFDTLVTFITFYAIFAYLIYETSENTNEIAVK